MNDQGEVNNPAVILDGRVNALKGQRKIIVGDGNGFGNLLQNHWLCFTEKKRLDFESC